MGIFRRMAAKAYSKEMESYLETLTDLDEETLGSFLIYSVWLRAILEVEGNLPTCAMDNGQLTAELHSYPILLKEIEKWQRYMRDNGDKGKAATLDIWVYSLRAIIRPELSPIAVRMWNVLMKTKKHWNRLIDTIKNEDKGLGVAEDKLMHVEIHARNILASLPPKQLGQS